MDSSTGKSKPQAKGVQRDKNRPSLTYLQADELFRLGDKHAAYVRPKFEAHNPSFLGCFCLEVVYLATVADMRNFFAIISVSTRRSEIAY
jgi:hypothetical protein